MIEMDVIMWEQDVHRMARERARESYVERSQLRRLRGVTPVQTGRLRRGWRFVRGGAGDMLGAFVNAVPYARDVLRRNDRFRQGVNDGRR